MMGVLKNHRNERLKNHRNERVSVSVEELVPQDVIEATISFTFIEENLRPYYCENKTQLATELFKP